jgi:ubiquinone/menaquinone biosynthesis C-methylase UbiE
MLKASDIQGGQAMMAAHRTYIPAAGHDWTLPLYDPFVKLLGGNSARKALVDQAELQPGERVLEIGSGTGTLLVMIARHHPDVTLTGLDPDPRALARARQKADAASTSIQLDRGFSDALPYASGSFDCAFSCFMFHHLNNIDEKRQTLAEIRRVLKPGGRLALLDFAPPASHHSGLLSRWLRSNHRLDDNGESRMLSFIALGGFADGRTVRRSKLAGVFHTAYYQAIVPAEENHA